MGCHAPDNVWQSAERGQRVDNPRRGRQQLVAERRRSGPLPGRARAPRDGSVYLGLGLWLGLWLEKREVGKGEGIGGVAQA